MNTNNFIQRDGKTVIPVPAGYRYIGEWTDFNLNFFNGPYIIDKQIPGCGFTEYVLTNPWHTILCSPRKILLENKAEQHPGDVYYARNEFDPELGVDKDMTKKITGKSIEATEALSLSYSVHEQLGAKEKMKEGLLEYCRYCAQKGIPVKVIVTYDSFKYVRDILAEQGLLGIFQIVVDEFQSIFVDSRFKASTEFDFLTQLHSVKNNICFVSATPMLDKYLAQLDYFKSLPFYELDWGLEDPGRIMKPELKVRKIKSVCMEIKRIIQEYKDGNFAVLANPVTGQLVQSREAVFYVNSITDIIKVIKNMGLQPDEVNILCSNTPQNQTRIRRKLGKKYEIGKVPLKGELHKMFTFCTRTVYLGADFYSNNARSFILSDANIDSLSVDISLDLPQILGRQRLIENPWKNHAEFYFKTLGKDNKVYKTREDFENRLVEKIKATEALLRSYERLDEDEADEKRQLCRKYRNDIIYSTYSEDYISVNYMDGNYIPVMNNLVYIAEQRAFDIQQVDYKDRFTVFNAIKGENGFKMDRMSEFVDKLRDTAIHFSVRLRLLCDTEEFTEEEKKIIAQQASESFDKYYNLLGPDKCRALGYSVTLLKKAISDLSITADDILSELLIRFKPGSKYSNVEIKQAIKEIYQKLGYNKSPKASDLEEYFDLRKVKFVNQDKKSVHGYEILGLKK